MPEKKGIAKRKPIPRKRPFNTSVPVESETESSEPKAKVFKRNRDGRTSAPGKNKGNSRGVKVLEDHSSDDDDSKVRHAAQRKAGTRRSGARKIVESDDDEEEEEDLVNQSGGPRTSSTEESPRRSDRLAGKVTSYAADRVSPGETSELTCRIEEVKADGTDQDHDPVKFEDLASDGLDYKAIYEKQCEAHETACRRLYAMQQAFGHYAQQKPDLLKLADANDGRVPLAKEVLKFGYAALLGRSSVPEASAKVAHDQLTEDDLLPAYPSEDVPTLQKQVAVSQQAARELGAKLQAKSTALEEAQAEIRSMQEQMEAFNKIKKKSARLEQKLAGEQKTSAKLAQDLKNSTARTSVLEGTIQNQRDDNKDLKLKWGEAASLVKDVGVNNIAELSALIKTKDEEIASARTKAVHQQNIINACEKDSSNSAREKVLLSQQLKHKAEQYHIEDGAHQLGTQKAEQKDTIKKMEQMVEGLRTEVINLKTDRRNMGDRLAKRASHNAQIKQVIRSNGLEVPAPRPGLEFFGWDDHKAPEEAVAALRQ